MPSNTAVKEVNLSLLDVVNPDHVQINITPDGRTLWVALNGVCRMRLQQLNNKRLNLFIKDERPRVATA